MAKKKAPKKKKAPAKKARSKSSGNGYFHQATEALGLRALGGAALTVGTMAATMALKAGIEEYNRDPYGSGFLARGSRLVTEKMFGQPAAVRSIGTGTSTGISSGGSQV